MKSILMLLWGRHRSESSGPARSEVEAAEARQSAERALHEAKAKTPYYESLSAELRNLRERNHFADNIRATVKEA